MHPTAIILALRGYKLCRYKVSTMENKGFMNSTYLLRIKQQHRVNEAMLTRGGADGWQAIINNGSLPMDRYVEIGWDSVDQSVLDTITPEMIDALP